MNENATNVDIMGALNASKSITPTPMPKVGGTDTGFFAKGGGYQNVMAGLNAFSGLTNAYTGMKQLNLAEDAFDFNKDLSTVNLANQAQTVNSQLADRQRARIASNPNAYQSLDQYMANNAVSGNVGG